MPIIFWLYFLLLSRNSVKIMEMVSDFPETMIYTYVPVPKLKRYSDNLKASTWLFIHSFVSHKLVVISACYTQRKKSDNKLKRERERLKSLTTPECTWVMPSHLRCDHSDFFIVPNANRQSGAVSWLITNSLHPTNSATWLQLNKLLITACGAPKHFSSSGRKYD